MLCVLCLLVSCAVLPTGRAVAGPYLPQLSQADTAANTNTDTNTGSSSSAGSSGSSSGSSSSVGLYLQSDAAGGPDDVLLSDPSVQALLNLLAAQEYRAVLAAGGPVMGAWLMKLLEPALR